MVQFSGISSYTPFFSKRISEPILNKNSQEENSNGPPISYKILIYGLVKFPIKHHAITRNIQLGEKNDNTYSKNSGRSRQGTGT